MKPNRLKLIRAIYELQPCTVSTLSNHLGVSVRSIKSYAHDINMEYPNAISSSREGYTINQSIAKAILDEDNNHVPQTSEERVVFLISQLINHHQDEAIDIYDLCDEMFISLSTLKMNCRR